MQTLLNEKFDLLKKILVEKFDAKTVYLFGSTAYGNSNSDSDVDLCIITNLKNHRKIDIIRAIRRELVDRISLPLDILIYSDAEFAERSSLSSTLEHKISIDGIKLHG